MTTTLVITADDFGMNDRRNRGIMHSVDRGIVTSVSMLANFTGFEDAVAFARERSGDVGFGVHLNVSEGVALTGASTATDATGRFFHPDELRERLRRGAVSVDDVVREFDAQADAIASRGIAITHVDGHHHSQILPTIAHAAARVARQLGVRWIRGRIEEPEAQYVDFPEHLRAAIDLYWWSAVSARPTFDAAGLHYPDQFIGFLMSVCRAWSPERTDAMLGEMGDGVCEWMTHPGHDDPDGEEYERAGRETEMRILTNPALRERLDAAGIVRSHFGKL